MAAVMVVVVTAAGLLCAARCASPTTATVDVLLTVSLTDPCCAEFSAMSATFGLLPPFNVTEPQWMYVPTSNGTFGCEVNPFLVDGAVMVVSGGGGCSYIAKAFNAQQSGATSLIIFDDVANRTLPRRPISFTNGEKCFDPPGKKSVVCVCGGASCRGLDIRVAFVPRVVGIALINTYVARLSDPNATSTRTYVALSKVTRPLQLLPTNSPVQYNVTLPPAPKPVVYNYAPLGISFGASIGVVALYWLARFQYVRYQATKRVRALHRIKKNKFSAANAAHTFSSGTCSVCLEDFAPNDDVLVMPPCRHVFHAKCVESWLDSANTCPNCKAELVPRTAIEDENGAGPAPARRRVLDTIFLAKHSTVVILSVAFCLFVIVVTSLTLVAI